MRRPRPHPTTNLEVFMDLILDELERLNDAVREPAAGGQVERGTTPVRVSEPAPVVPPKPSPQRVAEQAAKPRSRR